MAARTPPKPLNAVVRDGDHRQSLEALRDALADSFAEAGTRERAPIARQLQAVLVELAGLPVANPDDAVTDLVARRAARRGGVA